MTFRRFAPGAENAFAAAVARHPGRAPDPLEERDFEDGEHKIRPLASVRDQDVCVVRSLAGDATEGVNDRLVKLLFLTGALRDAGARRVPAP